MRKLVAILTLAMTVALGGAGVFAAPAQAADGWEVDFDFTFASKYIWRGINFVDDWVLQPSVNVAKYGFTFNVWGNMNLTDVNDLERKFDELDLTAEYAFALGDFTIPVGVIHYVFPNTDFDATTEVYTGVSYDWIVTPSILVYYDVDLINGLYVKGDLSSGYEFPKFSDMITMAIEGSVGIAWGSDDYVKGYFGLEDSQAFTDWYATVSLPVGIGEYFTVTPFCTYTALVDSDIADTTEDDSNWYGGVSIGVSF